MLIFQKKRARKNEPSSELFSLPVGLADLWRYAMTHRHKDQQPSSEKRPPLQKKGGQSNREEKTKVSNNQTTLRMV